MQKLLDKSLLDKGLKDQELMDIPINQDGNSTKLQYLNNDSYFKSLAPVLIFSTTLSVIIIGIVKAFSINYFRSIIIVQFIVLASRSVPINGLLGNTTKY